MSSISVILPTFGRKDDFYEALENLSDQSFQGFEVVVVDDNPEGSEERGFVEDSVEEFKGDLDILHICRGSKQGLASARNRGVDECTGDFVAFLDDDDRWEETKLEKQLEVLEESDFDACFTSRRLVSDSHPDHVVDAGDDVTELSKILQDNLIGSPSSVIVKKSELEAVNGFEEGMDGAEEWDMWSRLIGNGCGFKALNIPLTVYQSGNDSMASHSEIITPGREKFTEKFRKEIESNSNVASVHYLTRGIEQFEFKNFDTSKRYLLKSLGFKKTTWKAYIFLTGIFVEKYTGFELIERLVRIKHRFE